MQRNQSVLSKKIKTILNHPQAFKLTTYTETRESATGHFNLCYKIDRKQIIITAFWDNHQDPKKLLNLMQNQKKDLAEIAN